MEYKTITTISHNQGGLGPSIQTYFTLKSIPLEIKKDIQEWYDNKFNMKNISITISDSTGRDVIMLQQRRTSKYRGVNILELELRGLMSEIPIEDGTPHLLISNKFQAFLHGTFKGLSFCLAISPDKLNFNNLFEAGGSITELVKKTVKNVNIINSGCNSKYLINYTSTIVSGNKEDFLTKCKDPTINIVSGDYNYYDLFEENKDAII